MKKFAGLKLNWEKSECILLNHSETDKKELKKELKGRIYSAIKYLGIYITWNLQDIIKLNMDKLKKEINEQINQHKK